MMIMGTHCMVEDRVLSAGGWRELPSQTFLLGFLSLARVLTDVFSVALCLIQCTVVCKFKAYSLIKVVYLG